MLLICLINLLSLHIKLYDFYQNIQKIDFNLIINYSPMTTDINIVYHKLEEYMISQIPENDDYETDIIIDKSLYNINTFNNIVNNICNTPNNRLLEYEPSTLSILFMKDNNRFIIQGSSTEDYEDEIFDDNAIPEHEEEHEYIISVEICV